MCMLDIRKGNFIKYRTVIDKEILTGKGAQGVREFIKDEILKEKLPTIPTRKKV